jgi:oligopeptide transport system permease protein
LMHLIPGGPWYCLVVPRPLPPAAMQAFIKQYGLDQPLYIQYLSYMWQAAHGNLGLSCGTQSVNQIIADGFPLSAAFGTGALLLGVLAGVPFGVQSALRRNSWLDRAGTLVITVIIAIPGFVLAIFLLLTLAVNLHIGQVIFKSYKWQSWILPLIVLTLPVFAMMVRFTRTATLDTLGEDYVRTARMKGLPEPLITWRHVLRNALLPVVTLLGPLAADLLTGSFIVEWIFAIPGLGRAFVESIVNRDYPLLMGATLFYAVLLILFNLLVDLSYAIIDPRIAYRPA